MIKVQRSIRGVVRHGETVAGPPVILWPIDWWAFFTRPELFNYLRVYNALDGSWRVPFSSVTAYFPGPHIVTPAVSYTHLTLPTKA